jgi:hypothetical protein
MLSLLIAGGGIHGALAAVHASVRYGQPLSSLALADPSPALFYTWKQQLHRAGAGFLRAFILCSVFLGIFFQKSSAQQPLFFKDLRTYDLKKRAAPPQLRQKAGSRVEIVGFITPIDENEPYNRFLFLQAPFGGCFHVPPPQPNEVLLVNLRSGISVPYTVLPVMVEGKLILTTVEIDGFLVSVFRLEDAIVRKTGPRMPETDNLPANFHWGGG